MNRSRIGWLGIVALVALSAGCFRNTVSKIELKIPAMKTEACSQAVQAAIVRLGGEGAIQDIAPDLGTQTIWVTYDNVRLGRRNIEVAVRNAGFTVNDLPADPEARDKLSAECRGDE